MFLIKEIVILHARNAPFTITIAITFELSENFGSCSVISSVNLFCHICMCFDFRVVEHNQLHLHLTHEF